MADTARVHAEFFLALAESGVDEFGHNWGTADLSRQLVADEDNLRAALAWALETQTIDVGLRLVWILYFGWIGRGAVAEGIQWAEQLLALPSPDFQRQRVRALFSLCFLKYFQGQGETIGPLCREIQNLLIEVDDPLLEAFVHYLWNLHYAARGDNDSGTRSLRQGLKRAEESGLPRYYTAAFHESLGIYAALAADHRAALGYFQQAFAGREETAPHHQGGPSYGNIGFAHTHLNELQQAVASYAQAHSQNKSAGNLSFSVYVALGLAGVYSRLDGFGQAASLLGVAQATLDDLGLPWESMEAVEYEQVLARVKAELPPETFETAYAAGREAPLEETVEQALAELSAMDLPDGSDSK